MHHKTIISELKTALRIVLLKHADIQAVAADKSKNKFAYGIIIAGALLTFISQKLFFGSLISLGYGLLSSLIQIVVMIAGIYIISFLAKKLFKGQANHDEFFRVAAYASILSWVIILMPVAWWLFGLITGSGLIGLVSFVLGVWSFVILFVTLRVVHKLTQGGAAGIIAIILIAGFIIGRFGGLGYRAGGSYKFNTGDGKGVVDYTNKGFEMKVNGEDGGGTVKMDNGKITVTGPDGKVIEMNVPQQ
jgi:hypothetical protein